MFTFRQLRQLSRAQQGEDRGTGTVRADLFLLVAAVALAVSALFVIVVAILFQEMTARHEAALERERTRGEGKIIELEPEEDYSFDTGSAVSPVMRNRIEQFVLPEVRALVSSQSNRAARYNTVLVLGSTDPRPVGRTSPQFDAQFNDWRNEDRSSPPLASSNAELALLRAYFVHDILERELGGTEGLVIQALSSAQVPLSLTGQRLDVSDTSAQHRGITLYLLRINDDSRHKLGTLTNSAALPQDR